MRKNLILKAMALPMVAAGLIIASSCGKEPEQEVSDTIHVRVKASFSDADPASKAVYAFETGKLSFSDGDKLFIRGMHGGVGEFAGLLDYVSDNTFEGDIWALYPMYFPDHIEELFRDSDAVGTLLPKGYEEYGYLSIASYGSPILEVSEDKAFVTAFTPEEAKKLAVEQFSFEQGSYEWTGPYPEGFVLHPQACVLNYSIGGLSADTEYSMNVTMASTEVDATTCVTTFTDEVVIPGKVTTDADGYAYFAVGISPRLNATYTFFIGTDAKVSLSNRTLSAGSIYNVSRPSLTSSDAVGTIGMYDGREAMVAEVLGTKYVIATMNDGARTVEDFGTYAGHGESLPGAWQVPTVYELEDAFLNKKGEWTTQNSVRGCRWTIATDKTIFLPAAGRAYHELPDNQGYWGCYLSSTDPFPAETNFYQFGEYDNTMDKFVWGSDNYSFSIRPFCELP